LRVLHLVDEVGSHGFETEVSTFEVRTSNSTSGSVVFQVSTLEARATEMVSESLGKRSNVKDVGGITIEGGSGDVALEGSAVSIDELGEETGTETESVGQFVHNSVHVLFM